MDEKEFYRKVKHPYVIHFPWGFVDFIIVTATNLMGRKYIYSLPYWEAEA